MVALDLDLVRSANDEALDLSQALRDLVGQGFAAHGLANSPKPIGHQAKQITFVAQQSLAVAFVLWSHRMTTEYVERWGTDELRGNYLADLMAGDRIGSTALATALSDNAGKQELTVTYKQSPSGFEINGYIPWASNLRPGTLVVFGARDEASEDRSLFAVEIGHSGVVVKPAGELIGLNGTSSGSVRFENAVLEPTNRLTSDCKAFFRAMRPRFLLLQAAFCLGLAKAALESAQAAGSDSFAALLAKEAIELSRLETALETLAGELERYREDGPSIGGLPFVEVRLELALLAQRLAKLELNVIGGRGYFQSHPTSRRLRESAFLSIQAPTEEALRWELQRFD